MAPVTQILYAADIAFVVTALNARPGSVLLETGTGSGSLTHSLARAVGSAGRVLTYDFHAERCRLIEAELARHGLGGVVRAHLRDTQREGFPLAEVLLEARRAREGAGAAAEGGGAPAREGAPPGADDDGVDGIFLDVPRPYEVVPSCARVLRLDGRLVSFSPCIEQVQATTAALARSGFGDLATFETLVRFYATREEEVWTDTSKDKRATNRPADLKRRRREDAGGGAAADGGAGAGGGPSDRRMVLVCRPLPESRGHTGYLTVARRIC